MIIKQIRNATIKIHYGDKVFLVDPWLAPKDSFGSFSSLPKSIPFKTRDSQKSFISMPICNLPQSVDEILSKVDYYIITHIHPDHIDINLDGTVGSLLDKKTPILVQNEDDAQIFRNSGFTNIEILSEYGLSVGNIKITKVPALHGTNIPCGSAMGFIIEGENKTLYVAGDTVWYEKVAETLDKFHPNVIILNACAAELEDFGRLIMDAEDVKKVIQYSPDSEIILSHLDNVAHASLSRTSLSDKLEELGIVSSKVLIPQDGEVLKF